MQKGRGEMIAIDWSLATSDLPILCTGVFLIFLAIILMVMNRYYMKAGDLWIQIIIIFIAGIAVTFIAISQPCSGFQMVQIGTPVLSHAFCISVGGA